MATIKSNSFLDLEHDCSHSYGCYDVQEGLAAYCIDFSFLFNEPIRYFELKLLDAHRKLLNYGQLQPNRAAERASDSHEIEEEELTKQQLEIEETEIVNPCNTAFCADADPLYPASSYRSRRTMSFVYYPEPDPPRTKNDADEWNYCLDDSLSSSSSRYHKRIPTQSTVDTLYSCISALTTAESYNVEDKKHQNHYDENELTKHSDRKLCLTQRCHQPVAFSKEEYNDDDEVEGEGLTGSDDSNDWGHFVDPSEISFHSADSQSSWNSRCRSFLKQTRR